MWIFVAFLAATVLSYLLRPKAKTQATAVGETLPPQVAAGTPIPVIFGTAKVQPIVVSFSYKLLPVIVNGQVAAYGRAVTMTGLLGWGPLHWDDIIFNDTKKLSAESGQVYATVFDTSHFPPTVTTATTAAGGFSFGGFPGASSYGYGEIYLPALFGGVTPPGEGGIQGDWIGFVPPILACHSNRSAPGGKYAFFRGGDPPFDEFGIQPPIDDIKNFGTPPDTGSPSCTLVPTTSGIGRIRYPRFGYTWLGDVVQGTSPQLNKQEHIVLGFIGANLNSGDVNAVDFLLCLLTDQEWGLGISEALIDLDNFETVSEQFGDLDGDEHFGISGVLTQQQSADTYINEVLRTIDAVLYRAPDTGLLSIQTIRGGYDLSTKTALDESNVLELEWDRRDIADTFNQVTVAYTDRDRNWSRNIVTVTDHANVFASGGVRSVNFEFPYVSNETDAIMIAARELKSNTLPIGKGTVKVDRSAFDCVPGDVVKLSWAKYGLSGLAARVLSVNSGNLDDGSMEIDLAEDLFGIPDVPYTVDTTFSDPPSTSSGAVPQVQVQQSDDGTTGTISLTILPDDAVTLVEFSTESGISAASSFAGVSGGPVYVSPGVALVLQYPSRILWRVTYTGPDGSDTVLTGESTFYPANSAQPATISYSFTDDDPITHLPAVEVTVSVQGPASGIVSVKCVADVNAVPTDTEVRAATANTFPDAHFNFNFSFPTFAAGSILYIAAFAYDADGNESIKIVQPILNGAVAGSAGTVAALHLGYTLAAGVPTVTAVVNSYVSSVKFAASTGGVPSDATVRAATADSSAPFSATFGALTPGVPLYVAAFAYDSAANESPKALLTITLGTTFQGAWDSGTTYAPGDVVTVSGSSYVAIAASTNQTPPNVTYWTLVASAGSSGSNGTNGTNGTNGATNPFGACFDGTGLALTLTGTTKVAVGPVAASGTISKIAVASPVSGSVSFSVKKCARTSYPGSLADVTGGHNVVLSAASQMEDSTLTGWTKSFSADDVYEIALLSVDGVVKQATILLYP